MTIPLTRTSSSEQRQQDAFPFFQLFVLALCRIAEPIAITAIYPYAFRMIQEFHFGAPHNASFWAGILISAFALAEAPSGIFWGYASDKYGRKPVLIFGCLGTTLSLLIVGLSRSFGVAVFGRLIGGLLNGNNGVIQTMVSEVVTNPAHEPKAYSVMPFVWAIGCIIGPAVGGIFADPVHSFPRLFRRDGFWAQYPWFLPNLICAVLMACSMVFSYFFLKETHPDFQPREHSDIRHPIEETTAMIQPGPGADPSVDMRHDAYGTFNEVEVGREDEWRIKAQNASRPASLSSSKPAVKWLTYPILMLTVSLGLYTYHSMCFDHLLPIFLQDERNNDNVAAMATSPFDIPGGLGLSTQTVGVIMSVNGVISLAIQAFVFPFVADRLGVWKTFVVVVVLHPIAYFIVPYITFLPQNLVFAGIYVCLTIRQFFGILQYPVVLILLKQASPSPSALGRINGLAASVGGAARFLAPPIAGLLYGRGLDIGFTGLAYFVAGLVALVGVFQLYFVPREMNDTTVVHSLAETISGHDGHHEESPHNVVSVRVMDGV